VREAEDGDISSQQFHVICPTYMQGFIRGEEQKCDQKESKTACII
jgi:hypothetical protein